MLVASVPLIRVRVDGSDRSIIADSFTTIGRQFQPRRTDASAGRNVSAAKCPVVDWDASKLDAINESMNRSVSHDY